jgi:NaMN:DMB phosphoribosyltransferase
MAGAKVKVVDMGVATRLEGISGHPDFISCPVANGTSSISKGPAMTKDQAVCIIERGIQTVIDLASETDIFAIGEWV